MLTKTFARLLPLFAVLLGMTSGALAQSAATPANPEAAAARAEIQKSFGFTPTFLAAVPDVAIAGAWQEMRDLQISQKTALPCATKELIGLAVASQVPCKYCTYTHTQFATLSGATKDQVGEAVVIAGMTRHWSTFMNGMLLDEAKYRKQLGQFITFIKSGAAAKNPPPANPDLSDKAKVLADVKALFGVVPDFLSLFPAPALPGAWRLFRDVEVADNTAIDGKTKSLISLAVASQIPCRYCVIADTELAKLQGATDAEITEAIAMSGLTRYWSTVLNGLQIDYVTHKREIDRVIADIKSKSKGVAAAPASVEEREVALQTRSKR